jgi:hypothetical protein
MRNFAAAHVEYPHFPLAPQWTQVSLVLVQKLLVLSQSSVSLVSGLDDFLPGNCLPRPDNKMLKASISKLDSFQLL